MTTSFAFLGLFSSSPPVLRSSSTPQYLRVLPTARQRPTKGDIIRIDGRMESIIGDLESQTKFVKGNWEDNNSGDAYSSVEEEWLDAAGETLQLVHKAPKLLGENSVTAKGGSGKVQGIWS